MGGWIGGFSTWVVVGIQRCWNSGDFLTFLSDWASRIVFHVSCAWEKKKKNRLSGFYLFLYKIILSAFRWTRRKSIDDIFCWILGFRCTVASKMRTALVFFFPPARFESSYRLSPLWNNGYFIYYLKKDGLNLLNSRWAQRIRYQDRFGGASIRPMFQSWTFFLWLAIRVMIIPSSGEINVGRCLCIMSSLIVFPKFDISKHFLRSLAPR